MGARGWTAKLMNSFVMRPSHIHETAITTLKLALNSSARSRQIWEQPVAIQVRQSMSWIIQSLLFSILPLIASHSLSNALWRRQRHGSWDIEQNASKTKLSMVTQTNELKQLSQGVVRTLGTNKKKSIVRSFLPVVWNLALLGTDERNSLVCRFIWK
jgi:hypothetical protein